MSKFESCSILMCIINAGLSHALSCPSYELVKETQFAMAKQHPFDKDLWYLFSNALKHENKMWSISFSTFFYQQKMTDADALNQGQVLFDSVALKNHHPQVVWIPSGAFCDYTSEGSDYLVSAVSPPQYQIP